MNLLRRQETIAWWAYRVSGALTPHKREAFVGEDAENSVGQVVGYPPIRDHEAVRLGFAQEVGESIEVAGNGAGIGLFGGVDGCDDAGAEVLDGVDGAGDDDGVHGYYSTTISQNDS